MLEEYASRVVDASFALIIGSDYFLTLQSHFSQIALALLRGQERHTRILNGSLADHLAHVLLDLGQVESGNRIQNGEIAAGNVMLDDDVFTASEQSADVVFVSDCCQLNHLRHISVQRLKGVFSVIVKI